MIVLFLYKPTVIKTVGFFCAQK